MKQTILGIILSGIFTIANAACFVKIGDEYVNVDRVERIYLINDTTIAIRYTNYFTYLTVPRGVTKEQALLNTINSIKQSCSNK